MATRFDKKKIVYGLLRAVKNRLREHDAQLVIGAAGLGAGLGSKNSKLGIGIGLITMGALATHAYLEAIPEVIENSKEVVVED